jgi:FkbM family methyltransferase
MADLPRWPDISVRFDDEPGTSAAARRPWWPGPRFRRRSGGGSEAAGFSSVKEMRVATIIADDARHQVHYRSGASDKRVIQQIVAERDYDFRVSTRYGEIAAFLESQRQKGQRPLIVDAGANIGFSSLYFSLVFDGAVVVALEPEPANFALLQRNVAGRDVHCVRAALTSSEGTARISDPGEGAWGFRAERDTAGDVPCVSVGMLYRQYCGDGLYPFLVKIDIEGGEEDVFRANTEWLAETPLVMVELHDWLLPGRGTSRNFLRAVAESDRDFVPLGENILSIRHRF